MNASPDHAVVPQIKSARWWLFRFSLPIICLLLAGEVVWSLYSYHCCETLSVSKLLKDETGDLLLCPLAAGVSGTVEMMSHPYLDFILRPSRGGNNVGLPGRDYRLKKAHNFFTILIVGGSVASQFANAQDDRKCHLATILESRYDFGDRDLQVLNGALGGWKQPQQLLMVELYGDIVDAVVSIEGYNERVVANSGAVVRLEYPIVNTHRMNPLRQGSTAHLLSLSSAVALTRLSGEHWLLSHSRFAYWTLRFIRKRLMSRATAMPHSGADKDSLEIIFGLYPEWGAEEKRAFNIEQYKKYLRLMHSASQTLHIQDAVFLQPVPSVNKHLTKEEVLRVGNLDYGESYQALVSDLLTLRHEGVPVYSLLDIFDGVPESVYVDSIHCSLEDGAVGYRIMAERIADVLADLWQLPPREPTYDPASSSPPREHTVAPWGSSFDRSHPGSPDYRKERSK
ncbi:hypothetical protein JW905_02720 [bacterium]|nr:hypothetical protein [candidate division CSSED10-310 bacterium]